MTTDPAPTDAPAPGPRRRALLAAASGAALLGADAAALAQPSTAAAARKVLRVAFSSGETTFDPARIIDLYSRAVCSNIFEALYGYDPLARPVKIVPVLADGMPEASDDFRTWTVRLRRGVAFADSPAFRGRRREVQARDAIYAFQRIVDPANKSPAVSSILETGFVGLEEARQAAIDGKKPFDYDAPIAGLRALDPLTLKFTLKEPRPRFVETLAYPDITPVQAREAVEFHGDDNGANPVGTGPFRLKRWVRRSKIVLERNPAYRDRRYDASPAADDAEGQAILARLRGRRLPLVDEVEVSVIEEAQPMWLAFLNAEVDLLAAATGSVPGEFVPQAMPGGRIAPNLAKRGIRGVRSLRSDVAEMSFNLTDPVVGGLEPAQVALRRAISLAYDVPREITQIRRGQAIVAQSPMAPETSGYDPSFRSEMGEFDPARARALLDTYGFVDRDGDGFRERPDGRPLVLKVSTEPEQIYRDFNALFRRSMDAVGLRSTFVTAQWPENMKRALAGDYQIWMLGSSADTPDGQSALARFYGPQAGQQNLARFKLPAFDAIYDKLAVLPDGAERDALFLQAKKIAVAYMPYKVLVHRFANELMHPWVFGYRRTPFWNEWWHVVDVDPARREAGA